MDRRPRTKDYYAAARAWPEQSIVAAALASLLLTVVQPGVAGHPALHLIAGF